MAKKTNLDVSLFSNKDTVKFQILNLLTSEYNLRAKQIHSRLSRQGCKTSYQATFKAINQLLDEGIVEKNDFGFKISLNWVNSISNFIKNIQLYYSEDDNPLKKILLKSDSSGSVFSKTFSSIKELDEFLFNFISQENGFCAFVKHPWFPLIHTQEIASYSSTPKVEKTIFMSNETELDKDCAKFLKKMGEQVIVCNKTVASYSFSLYGDYIVEAFFSKDLVNYLESVFKNYKKILDIDLVEFNKRFFERKTKIHALIMHDPLMAQSLREWLFEN